MERGQDQGDRAQPGLNVLSHARSASLYIAGAQSRDEQHRYERLLLNIGGFIMEIENLAPHVQEVARALGDKLSEEEIAEELRKYVDVYRLSIPMAKKTIVKKYGGDSASFSVGFQRKLAELRPNEPNVDFVAKVLSANDKEITSKGEKKRIIYGFVGDDSTTLPYTAWETEGLALSKGEVISVKGAYTREYQGRVQVNFGNRVSIRKEDPATIPDIQVADGPPKVATIGELREGMGYVQVKGRVLSIDPKDVTVKGEAKRIFSGVLADETGKVQFTSWSDFKVKQGDILKISKATVKGWRGIPQLNFDDRAEVTKVKEKFPSAEELQKSCVSMISEISARGGAADATVRGAIIEIRDRFLRSSRIARPRPISVKRIVAARMPARTGQPTRSSRNEPAFRLEASRPAPSTRTPAPANAMSACSQRARTFDAKMKAASPRPTPPSRSVAPGSR